jgi:predicted DCC family thiol-disulfide oxidoreductase YuxK
MTIPVVRFTIGGEEIGGAASAFAVPAPPGHTHTVIYDGHCRVCQRLARTLHRWDGDHRLEIVPSQQPGVRARFPWISARAYEGALQLVARNGRTTQGAAAIETLLTLLPRGRLFSWLFRIPFARPIADRFYRWFARHRRSLGCGSHCSYRPLDVEFPE